MKKQLKLIFILCFITQVLDTQYVFADSSIRPSQLILKQEILTNLTERVEVVNSNTCYFKPANKGFNSKIVLNCDRIFDVFLEEVTSGEYNVFTKADLPVIISNLDLGLLLKLLKNDLQIFREETGEKDFLIEKNNDSILEISRLINLFLSFEDQKFKEYQPQIIKIVLDYSQEFEIIFQHLRMEISVSLTGELLQSIFNSEMDITQTNALEILTLLNILYGEKESVKAGLLKYITDSHFDRAVFYSTMIEKLKLFKLETIDNVEFFSQMFETLLNCSDIGVQATETLCGNILKNYGVKFELLTAKDYYTNVSKRIKEKPIQDINFSELEQALKLFRNTNFYFDFKNFELPEIFKNKNFSNKVDLNDACRILNKVPCILQSEVKKNETKSDVWIKLGVVVSVLLLVFFLYFKARKQIANSQSRTHKESEPVFESNKLSASERSELRKLRDYFDLRPLDSISELHRNYRKMVFKYHPDRLNDGGKEFVELQSRYLKTKALLERLDTERAKKISNS